MKIHKYSFFLKKYKFHSSCQFKKNKNKNLQDLGYITFGMLSGQALRHTHSILLYFLTFNHSNTFRKDGMGVLCVATGDGAGSVTSSLAEKVRFFQHYCTSAVSSYSQSRCVIYDWTCYQCRHTNPRTETPCATVR